MMSWGVTALLYAGRLKQKKVTPNYQINTNIHLSSHLLIPLASGLGFYIMKIAFSYHTIFYRCNKKMIISHAETKLLNRSFVFSDQYFPLSSVSSEWPGDAFEVGLRIE